MHTGRKVFITLSPAPLNTGIVFRLETSAGSVAIPATSANVVSTDFATTIGDKNGNTISTIEHLMAAFSGLGIDNCFVDLSAGEVPIMDGSAAPFIFLIQSAGVSEQDGAKRFIRVKESVSVKVDDKWARLEPYDGFKVHFEIDYDHPAISKGSQEVAIDFSASSFVREISRARTYGFTSDIEMLRKRKLALGGCLDNAVVMDQFRVLNSDGLRYEDEFVRHKILDAVGDLFQCGSNLIGQCSVYKGGHGLTHLLVRELLSRPETWEEVTFENSRTSAIFPQSRESSATTQTAGASV